MGHLSLTRLRELCSEAVILDAEAAHLRSCDICRDYVLIFQCRRALRLEGKQREPEAEHRDFTKTA